MLTPPAPRPLASASPTGARQRGVVLLVALIVLVALTLAGVALVRSVDTANLVAGNMSFHQSAIQAGERSTELAISNWLQPNNAMGNTTLHNDAAGYVAAGTAQSPAAGQSWDAYWAALVAGGLTPQTAGGTPDAAGNTVQYVVHRLCATTGAPHLANCARSPAGTNSGGSQSAGGVAPITNPQVYYRVTTRIQGPRRTVAYIQTIVAL
jgi:type IV pilus assembly protein PilX